MTVRPEVQLPTSFHARWSEDRAKAQPLRAHLEGVGRRAENFALAIRGQDSNFIAAARLAGLLHDLGKYRHEFQAYLNAGDRGRRSNETVHAIYGAAAAGSDWDAIAVAFAIAGHHAGLHDQDQLVTQLESSKFHSLDRYPSLLELADSAVELAGVLQTMKPMRDDASDSPARIDFNENDLAQVRQWDVFVRMLFSILVDADRVDSEKFEQDYLRKRNWERPTKSLQPIALLEQLEQVRIAKSRFATNNELNDLRNTVFQACRDSGASRPQGFFSLTVPTGGGKTISSMAFALSHAAQHALRRVIVVIPYLSIIEQNAKVYREILGSENVLEHHSAVELAPANRTNDSIESTDEPSHSLTYEQAVENWDCPVVVTTSVQFIESLFASATGRARKLHNIARSIVIFDEVQTLPTHLLEPTLDVLRTLQQHFGVSFVFCSATQPAFRKSTGLKMGFQSGEIDEIAPNTSDLFAKLKRVEYRFEPASEPWNWNRVAREMTERRKCLCVVNLKRHALEVYDALLQLVPEGNQSDVFHLSASMCAAHRLDVLGLSQNPPPPTSIKARLDRNDPRPCWVISTQLIEAGVDIDFPSVFRAMGPLDSIVQAAGRCNREGQLADEDGNPKLGEVIVFHPADSGIPNGIYSKATSIAPNYLAKPDQLSNDPQLFSRYFDELYQITPTDRVRRGEHTIQELREKLKFRTVGERAKVIADDTIAVVVPYRWAAKAIRRIQKLKRLDRRILRRMQRYMVNLRYGPGSLFQQLANTGRVVPILPDSNVFVLHESCYDLQRGVVFQGLTPEELMV